MAYILQWQGRQEQSDRAALATIGSADVVAAPSF
jgi:hypothetical protein